MDVIVRLVKIQAHALNAYHHTLWSVESVYAILLWDSILVQDANQTVLQAITLTALFQVVKVVSILLIIANYVIHRHV